MTRDPAFSGVDYYIAAADDQWFVPTTGYGDNCNSGTMAQRLAQCNTMVDQTTAGVPIGQGVVAT